MSLNSPSNKTLKIFKALRINIYVLVIFLGIFIIFFARHWLTVWIGVEVSIFAFIPFIRLNGKDYARETRLKYFLVQAIASLFLIIRGVTLLRFFFSGIFIFLRLILKLGVAPVHFWFIQIITGLDWPQVFVLITLQKIGPFIVLSWLTSNFTTKFITVAILSRVLGAIGGINEVNVKKILAFSSVNHFGWILSTIILTKSVALTYFFAYTLILASLTFVFNNLKILNFTQRRQDKIYLNFIILIGIFSLGGIPPLLGFFPKLQIVYCLLKHEYIIQVFILIFIRVITLYFYSRLLFFSLNVKRFYIKNNLKNINLIFVRSIHISGRILWTIISWN